MNRRRNACLLTPLVVICALAITLARPTPAYAYIDPGSGSMMLQLLFGGVAGVLVFIRLVWQHLVDRVRFRANVQRRS